MFKIQFYLYGDHYISNVQAESIGSAIGQFMLTNGTHNSEVVSVTFTGV